MYNSGIEIPQVDFSNIAKSLIPTGSYFVGFDLGNFGKLSKMDNSGTIIVIEGSSTITSITGTSPILSSGGMAPTISITQVSGSTDGYLSSADWLTFSAKLGGSGTINYISKFTGSGTLSNSQIFDDGTYVGIGTSVPDTTLHIDGSIKIVDGNQGIGKVLTSDADGLATWDDYTSYTLPIASSTILGGIKIGTGLSIDGSGVVSVTGGVGSISGSGTNNYVARWTPSGTALGNSLIRDDATSIAVGAAPVANYRFYIETSTQLYGLYAKTSLAGTGNQIGILGMSDGASTGGINAGVVGGASGNSNINIGGSFSALSATIGTNIGIQTQVQSGASNYVAQLRDGTEGIGKVLTCMTADGKANWVTPTSVNLQKVITTTYTLTDADNDYIIFINNGASAITISLGAITIPNFSVGFIQEGTADVTFSGVGLSNPVGLKCLGQGYQTFIERKLSTSTYYLLGNTKA